MKFARDFKDTLAKQDFPEEWVKRAIPYGQLKKCLKKVQKELEELGLDPETLRALLHAETTSPVALEYKLKSSGNNTVTPKLTVQVHLKDGVAVDANLTPASRRFIEKIAADLSPDDVAHVSSTETSTSVKNDSENGAINTHRGGGVSAIPATVIKKTENYETIEIPLVFDSEFFDVLQTDVLDLEELQAEEQKKMTTEIAELGNEVSTLARPSRFSKSDMARWREIFELYLDAEVFFATHEQEHGARSSQKAIKQLQWFQNEVEKRHLAQRFKIPESQQAFTRFLTLNLNLLKNLQFQELNRLAVSKILKKFDKRTQLGVSGAFPSALQSHQLLTGSMAKDVCATMSKQLVSVVPQINDYLCPVCFSVAYRPVRLDCQHVFCIRCIIKIQRQGERYCPLCRADVVMSASADNLDQGLEKYMRKYFPKEVKEKQRANDIERGIEDYGPNYKHQECLIM